MNSINYPATIRRGVKGLAVKYLQALLIQTGRLLTIDGDFCAATYAAVTDEQQRAGLSPDGVVGPKTWAALMPKVVSYKQMDPRWTKTPFTAKNDPSQTIGSSGCGPTCTAMIAATWGSPHITPVETCAEAKKGGFRTANSGTSHAYFPAFAQQYGFKCVESRDMKAVETALKRGALVVGNMGPGKFTRGGHFVLLWAYDDYADKVYVADPGSSRAERTYASRSLMAKEAKKFFIFDRR